MELYETKQSSIGVKTAVFELRPKMVKCHIWFAADKTEAKPDNSLGSLISND